MNRRLLLCMLLLSPLGYAQSTLTTPGRTNPSNPCDQANSGERSNRCDPGQTMPSLSTEPRRDEWSMNSNESNGQARVRRLPLAKTEFEIFAEDVTGHPLLTYGRELFEDVPSTFAPVDRVPVPADYVLGPGDELLIRAWGKIDLDARVTIDRDGQIYLPKVGALNLAGLRYGQVDGFLHSAIGALFKDFDLNVTMGQLRSIQIFVLGSARRPGAYTVGSLSTMVNALFVSGGPSATGSLRHVQLIRNNQVVTEFDIYDLVKRGDKSRDRPLLPGDILYIPPVGPQAAIVGSVEEPGIYELNGKTTVASALQAAGGLTSLAETRRAVLERVEDHSKRRVEEFSLNDAGMQRVLQDGDLLQILPVSPEFENTITLRGNVAQPGRYAWHQGMRISDLIPSRGFLLTREYWNRENHVVLPDGKHQFGDPKLPNYRATGNDQNRSGPANGSRESGESSARPYDRSNPERNSNRLDGDTAETEDVGPRPTADDRSERDQGDEAQDQRENSDNQDSRLGNPLGRKTTDIVRNNVEINWHYASIERLDERDLSPRLIALALGNAIDDHTSTDNQLLQAGDVVTVFSRTDIPLPIEEHATFVRVGGEVNAPGIYRVNPGATLRDAVKQAGGLTTHSYLYASQLLRVSTRKIQEEQLKRSTEQMQRELSSNFANNSLPSANKEADQSQLSMRAALIARISSIAPTGRVVLEMKSDASTLDDIPDFTLEDGDSFYVPPKFSTVQVSGAVYNENAFRYQQNKLTTAYLADAGGATRDADVKRMFLVRADGTVISRQRRAGRQHASFEKTALLPGDAIVIPVKLNMGSGWRQLEEITGIASQTALSAASLAVIAK